MAAAALSAAAAPQGAPAFAPGAIGLAIRECLDARTPAACPPLHAAEPTDLRRLYGDAGAPLWLTADGVLPPHARDALAVLRGAADEGLDPAAYETAALEREAAHVEDRRGCTPRDAAAFDLRLSAAVLRYLRHLHLGRVDPQAAGFRLTVPPDGHDFPALLREAIAGRRFKAAVSELAPALGQYQGLRAALVHYRALAAADKPFPFAPLTAMHPHDRGPLIADLRRRLIETGDLEAAPGPLDPLAYDDDLVEAVQRFQARHGLSADGVVGKTTVAALRVPLAWRVRQIELALERLRWLPDVGGRRVIALNIPMYHLWAWDAAAPGAAPSLDMRAIVGRALNTQTPVFGAELRRVIFRPYWNVPRSIVRNEILPRLAADPGWIERNHMELLPLMAGDRGPVVANTAENRDRLARGLLRLRQRPGPTNALGLIKFDFPNAADVYAHGTPAQELFARTRRDFSHGCVRVEDPVALAEWVLRDAPGWPRERIVAATNDSSSREVTLARPIQVLLFYTTAIVTPADGTVRFADDIYRHDVRLDRALASLSRR